MIEIIPTVVPNSLSEINEVSERYSSFASFFHIDVADGRFAPNTTWLPSEGDRLPKDYSYEVHLMVSDPHAVGLAFAKAGAHTLIGHIEAFSNTKEAERTFEEWKNFWLEWYKNLGINPKNLRFREHAKDELAHYAKKALDIEYNFAFSENETFKELEGIHHRGDWDLSQHQKSKLNFSKYEVYYNCILCILH